MVRKTRRMPALIGTVALVAGCGSSGRAEVSGVVVDARTGDAIAGARVVAQDGTATRTDAAGRFHLTVSSSGTREIRASAAAHADAHARIDVRVDENAAIVIELVPCAADAACDASAGVAGAGAIDVGAVDPDAVLRWIDDLDRDEWMTRGVRAPSDAVWGAREQWALGAMTSLDDRGAGDPGAGDPGARDHGERGVREEQARPECASCHDGAAFAAAHTTATRAEGPIELTRADGPCSTCHEVRDERSDVSGAAISRVGALRAFEHVDRVAGRPADALGSSAVCVECHRGVASAGAHAPQAEIVLGRGARTVPAGALSAAPHGALADGCVQCHGATWREADAETLTLGHTFSVREAGGGIARDACSACHGDVEPERIARGDWDGDGVRGGLSEEHDRAIRRVRGIVEESVRRARVAASCGARRTTAASFEEHAGAIVLVDLRGVVLGDCDEDGTIDPGERATTIDALPREVRDAAWDVMLLERDGSRGVHNPGFAFALMDAIESRL